MVFLPISAKLFAEFINAFLTGYLLCSMRYVSEIMFSCDCQLSIDLLWCLANVLMLLNNVVTGALRCSEESYNFGGVSVISAIIGHGSYQHAHSQTCLQSV